MFATLSKNSSTRHHSQSGQIAVIVLLIMVVLLVMGLSLATRTTQESFLSQQSSETARVWNAAETGAEDALSRLSSGSTPAGSSVTTTVNDSAVSATVATQNTVDTTVKQLSTLTVNLVAPALPSFTIDWGAESDQCARASLLVSLYYTESSVTKVVHYTLGSACTTRNDGFNNTSITGVTLQNIGGPSKYRRAIIALPAGGSAAFTGTPILARIKPVYADTSIAVSGNSAFPEQSYLVTSTAQNNQTNSTGREVRTVQVTRTLPSGPSILDYALYSGGAITKP
jgi:hypothetical protein